MTMEAAIGFEWGTFLEDPYLSHVDAGYYGAPTFSTSIKRQGAYSICIPRTDAWSTQLKRTFSAPLSEFYIQFGYYGQGWGTTAQQQLFRWSKGATVLGGLQFNFATGNFEVYVGNYVTLVGSFAPPALNIWVVIEFHIKIGASGIIQAKKDMGALLVDFAGNTKPGSDADVDSVSWTSPFYNQGGGDTYVDDIIINDTAGTKNNSWPGGLRIIRLAPTSDSGSPQFTPTPAGAHYSAVDEIPPSATDNIVSLTSGQVDRFGMADCPADVHSIAAIQLMAFGSKTSSNPPTQLALGLQMAGGDHLTATLPLAVSQAVAKETWEVSPETGVPLTVTEINNAILIVESVA